MKTRKLNLLLVFLLLLPLGVVLLGTGCKKEESVSFVSDDIGKILTVFELKYGDSKKIIYKGEEIEVSIRDVEDRVTLDCSLADFGNNQEALLAIRIYASLQINSKGKIVKVASKPCGAFLYENNGHDIQDVNDYINDIKSAPANLKDSSYFADTFMRFFGEGTLIEDSSFRIFMAKAFPTNYNQPDANIEDYQFVFIVTSRK